jgi:nicotinamidase-related amidase
MLGRWWGELIVEGTDDHGLLPELGIRDTDTIIPKRRYSAFHETDLDDLLRQRGVEDLASAGVMTNLCVETSARDAFVRDYLVRVLMDATATVTDAMQEASLVNLAYGFAHVQSVDAWLRGLGLSPESSDG